MPTDVSRKHKAKKKNEERIIRSRIFDTHKKKTLFRLLLVIYRKKNALNTEENILRLN